jgi:hypothetical protein
VLRCSFLTTNIKGTQGGLRKEKMKLPAGKLESRTKRKGEKGGHFCAGGNDE